MSEAVDRCLRALAAHGLPDSTLALPAVPLDAPAWDALVARVCRERLEGRLVRAVADGTLPATAGQAAHASEIHLQAMSRSLLADRCLLTIATAFESEAIEQRVLKGTALAHTAYLDPSERVFADIDVLVPAEDFDRAGEVLTRAGFRRPRPALRPGFDRRFGKAVTYHGPDGDVVDLHRTLAVGPFGLTVRLPELFASAQEFRIGNRQLAALSPELQLLHACYTAVLTAPAPRLAALRDIAQLLLSRPISDEEVLGAAARWQAESVLALGISRTWSQLALASTLPLTVWAARYEPSRREQLALATYLPTRRYGSAAIASLRVIHGAGAKAAFARALLFPNRDFLATQQVGYLRWLRRGMRALLDGGPR